ncbi:MAG: ribonuclease H-like domain-containing protein [Dehalococcoidia bacterium]
MTTFAEPSPATSARPGTDPAVRERLRALIREIESRSPRPRGPAAPVYVPRVGGGLEASEVYPHEDVRAETFRNARDRADGAGPRRAGPVALEEMPGARLRVTESGTCVVREVRRPLAAPPHLVATGEAFDLGALPALAGAPLVRLAPDAELEDAAIEDLLFLDIETTGLGGAGAMAFLVATGRVEGAEFVLRQYIAPSPPAEASLLEALIEDAGLRDEDPVLVTYNGRMFDAPMLDGRATMHRRRGGFEALRHLDLLMPARIAYRGLLPSCRLVELEYAVLGMTRPPSEASGAEAPGWYFRFLRTGDARMLIPIIEHNERDVVALAALTARLAGMAERDGGAEGVHALAAGRLLARRGEHEEARAHLERAVATLGGARPQPAREVEALMRLAALHKAAGRRDLAAPLWHEVAERPGAPAQRAYQELAIYYERHARDLSAALAIVERALEHVEHLARLDAARAARWRDALLLRRSRVHSRLARRSSSH